MEKPTLERCLLIRAPSEREIELFTSKLLEVDKSLDVEIIELSMMQYTDFNGNWSWNKDNTLMKLKKKARIKDMPKDATFRAGIVLPSDYETFDKYVENKSALIKVNYHGRDTSGFIVGLEFTTNGYRTGRLEGISVEG